MGLEMEFEKNCRVGLSPNTVLPTHRHSCVEKTTKGRPPRKDDLLSIKEGFVEISFQRYRSTSCKVPSSRPVAREGNVELKRGSIYQSSREVREIKKMGTFEGRQKIEKSRSSDSSFSYRIVDSLRNSEGRPHNRSAVLALESEFNAPSAGRPHVEPCSLDSILEICDPDDREEHSAEALGEDPTHLNLRSDPVAGPPNNGNELLERDQVNTLHKSFSAKVEMHHTPSPSESERSSSVSSKGRFNNIRKMFDPFTKSKSLRSPSYIVEPGRAKTTGMGDKGTRIGPHQKSLLPEVSDTVKNSGSDSLCINRDSHQSSAASSPVHLHGNLKLQNKHGMPYFEFSLNCAEDVFVARTWKADNGFSWVYTFHAIGGRKKSNASGVGMHGNDRDSSMVGQMQVSCYLCSELKDGAFDNSMVTEFVLYDISHARQIAAEKENNPLDGAKHPKGSNPSTEGATLKLADGTCPTKVKPQRKSNDSDSSAWPFADLNPSLEIGAVVMQVPFGKRESLKCKRGNKTCDKVPTNLLKLSMVEQKKKNDPDSQNSGNLTVIIPSGNHGLPSVESNGPSSLLDRWRLGGGCDCGGWDMSCPLTVLGNPNIHCADNHLLEENPQPLELFVQGSKEKTPALTMTLVEDGQYAVDFHAQLSTLQAFSMCVSILHGTETSAAASGHEENTQLSQSNSLKVLKEEVKFLIEAVTEREKKKVTNRVKKVQPSYVLDPPFSPIARV